VESPARKLTKRGGPAAYDHAAAEAFAAIPGDIGRHLFHNKRELTFTWTCA
jgi:hypothetical protein